MNIDRLIWAIEEYKNKVRPINSLKNQPQTPQQRAQTDQYLKECEREVETVFNECVDERVRSILKELGLTENS